MGIDLKVIQKYLQQAMDEFDTNPLASKFMRRMLNAEPDLFCDVAIEHLSSNERSNAHRFVAIILARKDELFGRLTCPDFGTRDSAIKLFKRFHEVDPSFDLRLARKLPGCRYGDQASAFDSRHPLVRWTFWMKPPRAGGCSPFSANLRKVRISESQPKRRCS